ncbi:MAG TPA: zf-HC2 domain-containing protein [Longimicrobium sp.]|jgi:anti-sigma factor RsiW
MKHLDEGTLQALADGELPQGGRRAAEAHLATCGTCAAELAGMRADRSLLSAALARADVPPPTAAAQMSLRRRRAAAGQWAGEARRALLRAAVLVLALGGVAAAAVPGWPLRVLIERAVAPASPAPAPKLAPATPAPEPVAPAPAAGISILPDGGAVRVVLNGAAPGLRVHTRVTDGELVEVSAAGAAAGARFRTGPGRIEVLDAGAGEVRIALPRAARAAVVEVDGRVYVAKEGERLRVMGPAARSATAHETEFRVQD